MSLVKPLSIVLACLLHLQCTGGRIRGITGGTVVPTPTVSTSPTPLPSVQPPPVPLRAPFDLVAIVGTGQSLSVGVAGDPIIDTQVLPGQNVKLFDSSGAYDITQPTAPTLSMRPLTEPLRTPAGTFGSNPYPGNIYGETPHTAMGGQLSALAQAANFTLTTAHSAVGQGGAPMSVIGKNGTGNAYAAALYETRALTTLAKAAQRSFGVGAVVLTHGEADVSNPNYEAALLQLYHDTNADLAAITGQKTTIPLLASQQNSFPSDFTFPSSTVALWRAGIDYAGKIIVTGPKYQYPYAEHVHLLPGGYRRLGEKYAEVYFRSAILGEAWRPLQPNNVIFTDPVTLNVQFDIPNPPLQWDIAQPAPHQTANQAWAAGRGFEVLDAHGNPVSIVSVSLDVNSGVQIHLASPPAHPVTLQYAITQDATGYNTGTGSGRSGQLCDSDPFVGIDRQVLQCTLTQGQTTLQCTNGLAARNVSNRVKEAAASLVAIANDTQATLSAPWTAASTTQPLTFYANQFNYCVAFSLTVN